MNTVDNLYQCLYKIKFALNQIVTDWELPQILINLRCHAALYWNNATLKCSKIEKIFYEKIILKFIKVVLFSLGFKLTYNAACEPLYYYAITNYPLFNSPCQDYARTKITLSNYILISIANANWDFKLNFIHKYLIKTMFSLNKC